MSLVNVVGMVGILGLMAGTVGCAASNSAAEGGSPSVVQPATKQYSADDLRTIMAMREGGAALAEVAERVGGTRADVRAAERSEKLRLRAQRGPGKPLGQLLAFW